MTRFTREHDEMHLDWLRRNDEGVTAASIARDYNVPGARVRTMLNRIRKADQDEHREELVNG